MTIREMHVTVEAQLAQVNAFRRRSFQAPEIDQSLNRQIREFTSKRVANYLNKEQESMEEITTLIEKVTIPAIYMSETEMQVPMPANYGALLFPRFFGRNDCNDGTKVLATTAGSRYKLQVPYTTKGTAPYYQNYTINVNGTIIFDITDPTKGGITGWAGVQDKDEFLHHHEYIMWWLMQNGLYVNRSKTNVATGFIYGNTTFTITIDGTANTASTEAFSEQYYTDKDKEYYGSVADPFSIDELLHTPFFGPHKKKLMYTMVKPSQLRIFVPSGIILTEVEINYVRRPRVVDVVLGSNCDLPDTGKVHDTICLATVRELMGDTADERFPIKAQQESRVFNNLS